MYQIKLIHINGEIRKESYTSYEEAIQHFHRYSKKRKREYRGILLIGPDHKVEKLFRLSDGRPQVFTLYDGVLLNRRHYTIVGLRTTLDEALIEDVDIHSNMNRFWVSLDNLIVTK